MKPRTLLEAELAKGPAPERGTKRSTPEAEKQAGVAMQGASLSHLGIMFISVHIKPKRRLNI